MCHSLIIWAFVTHSSVKVNIPFCRMLRDRNAKLQSVWLSKTGINYCHKWTSVLTLTLCKKLQDYLSDRVMETDKIIKCFSLTCTQWKNHLKNDRSTSNLHFIHSGFIHYCFALLSSHEIRHRLWIYELNSKIIITTKQKKHNVTIQSAANITSSDVNCCLYWTGTWTCVCVWMCKQFFIQYYVQYIKITPITMTT